MRSRVGAAARRSPRSCSAAPGTRRKPSEFHLRRLCEHLALLGTDVEEFLGLKTQRTREQRGRELLDAGIVFLHCVVEEAARGRDFVLDVGQISLELLKILVGL